MPIVKVPVQHKFGIVSLSRAEELLAQGRQKPHDASPKRFTRSSSSTEVTQAFISKYNASSEINRDDLDTRIKKSLLHAKHKAGLRMQSPSTAVSPAGSVMNQDVSSAWLELILLCQCYGQYQQEVLVTLATSLNHAQLSVSHIPSLFYIAGLCYQWLKSDVIDSNLLRSGELLLLKILYLVSIRIYFHHLTGFIADTCTRDEVRQFKFDLEGFENREKAYRNFPEALLHWKVSLEVGLLICENYSKPLHDPSVLPLTPSSVSERSQKAPKHERMCPSRSQSRSVAASVVRHDGHHLSPILWHSLDVWQCARQGCEALNEAIEDLLNCSTEFESDKWLEGLIAMDILCAASQINLSVLQLVQSLAEGCSVSQHPPSTNEQQQSSSAVRSQADIESPKPRLSDTVEKMTSLNETPPTKQPRFILSSHGGSPSAYGNRLKERQCSVDLTPSTVQRVNTLNVLGMQPDFNECDIESVVHTMTYSGIGENHTVTASEETTSKEENSRLKSSVQRSRFSEYSSVLTVGTQSLIDNETIPDTPPSRYTSNATMLPPLDSTSTLEHGVSMVKSMGLIDSNNSKMFSSSNPMFIANVSSTSSRNGPFDTQTGNFESTEPLVSQLLSPTEEKMAALRLSPSVNENHDDHQEDEIPNQLVVVRQRSHSLSIPGQSAPESQCTHYTHSTAPLSGGAGIPGSQVPPSTTYRHSVFSASFGDEGSGSLGSLLGKKQSQFQHWPIEVSIVYTLNMTSVVIYGRSSIIQKTALEGKAVTSEEGGMKYGLLQLSEYTTEDEENSNEHNKASSCWSVRHAALLGLSRVCKVCHGLPMKDGLSSVAWSKLMQRHSLEREDKVLEAYKISQSYPDTDGPLLAVESQPFSSPLSVHIANGLSVSFLPPVTPAPDAMKQTTKRTSSKNQPRPPIAASKLMKDIPAKVQTRQDVKGNMIPDYITRTTGALNKIAEEHWRRQMVKELEEEQKKAAAN